MTPGHTTSFQPFLDQAGVVGRRRWVEARIPIAVPVHQALPGCRVPPSVQRPGVAARNDVHDRVRWKRRRAVGEGRFVGTGVALDVGAGSIVGSDVGVGVAGDVDVSVGDAVAVRFGAGAVGVGVNAVGPGVCTDVAQAAITSATSSGNLRIADITRCERLLMAAISPGHLSSAVPIRGPAPASMLRGAACRWQSHS